MGDIIRLERDPDKRQTEEFDLLITGVPVFLVPVPPAGACGVLGRFFAQRCSRLPSGSPIGLDLVPSFLDAARRRRAAAGLVKAGKLSVPALGQKLR